ncbi:MAG: DUF4382 domain-containing protein [Spirochaetes bacterium]|nr:DUF4382 domain-containing protein [Spirochaetota bacterium]
MKRVTNHPKESKWIALLVILGTAVFFAVSCSTSDDSSAVAFKLTDAPDTSGITNVKISVSQIKVNESADATDGQGGSWKILTLNPAKEVDLLTLTNGVTANLGELEIAGGTQINQIRFVIDSAKVSTDNGSTYSSLNVPSNSVKIVNAFQVPLSGSISIVLDFDVSKSVVKTGNGQYILKPAIRSIVENEAGWILGTAPAGATVYAYKDEDYVDGTEPTTSSDRDGDGTPDPAFPKAYASTLVKPDGTFKIAFLEAGTYDLVLVKDSQGPKFFDVNLGVQSNKGTNAGDLAF